jgi:N-acetylmuramoyl-L-alanine amidase-like protein
VTLERVQIPSPNHSSSRPYDQLLVVHTSEGATTFRSLGNFLANPSSQVSYHVGFDDTTSAQIGEYVQPPAKSWSAHSANSYGEHGCCCTPSGASSGWSRNDWLARPRMLDACRAWLQEEGARYGIPLVKITPDQIRAGVKGVCGHADCVQAGLGGNHTDPGPNFPWDYVTTGAPPKPPPEEVDMWTTHKDLPAGENRGNPQTIQIGLPLNRKSATVTLYTGCAPSEGASLWGAIGYTGTKQGLWGGGNTWELFVPGQKPIATTLPNSAQSIEIHHMGGTKAPLAITISGE